jgi:hypothetical protein
LALIPRFFSFQLSPISGAPTKEKKRFTSVEEATAYAEREGTPGEELIIAEPGKEEQVRKIWCEHHTTFLILLNYAIPGKEEQVRKIWCEHHTIFPILLNYAENRQKAVKIPATTAPNLQTETRTNMAESLCLSTPL